MDITEMIKKLMLLESINISNLATQLNTSQPNLSKKLLANDLKISELERILNTLGYDLIISYRKKGGTPMFDVENLYTNHSSTRFLVDLFTNSAKEAEYFVAQFLLPVRNTYIFADLYAKGSCVVLDTPNKNVTINIANRINEILINNSNAK